MAKVLQIDEMSKAASKSDIGLLCQGRPAAAVSPLAQWHMRKS